MTIIAYRDGVMAADSQVSGDYAIRGSKKKIYRTNRGDIVAASGGCGGIAKFIEWLQGDRAERFDPKPFTDSFGAILVTAEGQVVCYDDFGLPVDVIADYHADGAGRDFALGAMAVGASAEEAVRVAIKHSPHCGGDIQIERLA